MIMEEQKNREFFLPKNSSEYRIGKLIGRGQYGSVYEGFNLSTGTMMAIK